MLENSDMDQASRNTVAQMLREERQINIFALV